MVFAVERLISHAVHLLSTFGHRWRDATSDDEHDDDDDDGDDDDDDNDGGRLVGLSLTVQQRRASAMGWAAEGDTGVP